MAYSCRVASRVQQNTRCWLSDFKTKASLRGLSPDHDATVLPSADFVSQHPLAFDSTTSFQSIVHWDHQASRPGQQTVLGTGGNLAPTRLPPGSIACPQREKMMNPLVKCIQFLVEPAITRITQCVAHPYSIS